MSKVVDLPKHRIRGSKKVLRPMDVTSIRFYTQDDRVMYVDDDKVIQEIMDYIIRRDIVVNIVDPTAPEET